MAPSRDIKRYRNLLAQVEGGRYTAESFLGIGSFGAVVRAFDKIHQTHVAIKFIEAGGMHQYLGSEVCNHRTLRHPHVIRFKKVFEVEGHVGIVMEFANGTNLRREIRSKKRFEEPIARWIFQQLIVAVDYCHKKGIASRDIKADNVLLVNGHKLPVVKLSDFGYSVHRKSELSKSIVGTLDYMAPEVLNSVNEEGYDARKADIWSCGVVLYVMLVGDYPFSPTSSRAYDNRSKEMITTKICDLEYSIPTYVSTAARHLLSYILTSVERRYSIEDILNDPWFGKQFPEQAMTMNEDILRLEKKRRLNSSASGHDSQSDEEIAKIINRALQGQESTSDHNERLDAFSETKEFVSDTQIDREFDAVENCFDR